MAYLAVVTVMVLGFWRIQDLAGTVDRQSRAATAANCRAAEGSRSVVVDVVNRLTAPRQLGRSATPQQKAVQAEQNAEAERYRKETYTKLGGLACSELADEGKVVLVPVIDVPPPPGQGGAAGEQGPSGLTGPTGPPGPSGQGGPMGNSGKDGKSGDTGTQGGKGDRGATGPQGPQGEPAPTTTTTTTPPCLPPLCP